MNSDKALHIAVICNYKLHPDRFGGMDRFFVAFDAACKELNYQVHWFFSKSAPHQFYDGLNVHADQESVEEAFLETLTKNKTNYSVVVTHFVELCTPFYKKIKKETAARIIAVDHNPRPIGGFPLKKRIKNYFKGIFYARYIDTFVGVSNYTCRELIKDYGTTIKHKTVLIYNGIDVRHIEQRTDTSSNRFVVVSHLRKSKGIQDLIRAVSNLEEHDQKLIKIDVYGDGPYRETLEFLVAQNKLEKQVVFFGSSSDVYRKLKDYAYLLQPTYMECFSLSILESLGANVPVVTTMVGGNTEIIKEGVNGYLYEAGDLNALQQILTRILNQSQTVNGDVRSLIEEHFNLKQMVENHLKILACT